MLRRSFALTALLLAGAVTAASAQAVSPVRSGFTLLLDIGVGFQRDEFFGQTETGVGGLNLGLGGFLSENLALMFRGSGTTVSYAGGTQISGTGGGSLQYWVNDKLFIEGGAGVGFWDFDSGNQSETALGLILAAGYSIWNNAGHNLFIGVEYAPAFTDPDTVHNVGIVFGWQLL